MQTDSASFDVTVVIPVKNRREAVERAVQSVLAQEGVNVSLIVVDNGSTDGTPQRLVELKRQAGGKNFTIVSEPTPGASAARNRGLKMVHTPWVMFFDSDDIMLPGHIRRMLAKALESGAELVTASTLYVGLDGSRKPVRAEPEMRMHLAYATLATQRMLLRTNLARLVGGWNEELPAWNDWEFGIRLLLQKPRVAQVTGEPLVWVIATADSITGVRYSDAPGRREPAIEAARRLLEGTPYEQFVGARYAMLGAHYYREGARRLGLDTLAKALRGVTVRRRLLLRAMFAFVAAIGRGDSWATLKICR